MHDRGEWVYELTAWYRVNKRLLPWRESTDPYRIWISEIMLQQTRIEAVMGYYNRFMEAFPNVQVLAAAPEEHVLKQWEGLGYYSRARNLHKAARIIDREYGGQFPEEYELIRKLPGIGEYTAGAIGAIAFGLPVTAIDGNVMRVVSRIYALEEDILQSSARKRVKAILESVYPEQEASNFVQGLMELGERICIPGIPRCGDCPIKEECLALRQGRVEELPVRKKKEAQRIQVRLVAIIWKDGRLLLHRRPAGGVLAGLWEYPGADAVPTMDFAATFAAQLGLQVRQQEQILKTHHVFTHIRWDMEVYAAELSGDISGGEFGWFTPDQIRKDVMMPTAFKKISQVLLKIEGDKETD